MKSSALSFPLRFLAFLLLFAAILALFSAKSGVFDKKASSTEANHVEKITTVILDAGHGGEDGGASSASGILEKELNLKIVLLLRDLLVANGIRVILTRDTDVLLYDRNVDYQGRKKVLDLAARRRIAEENPSAVFVSIHMNTYPLESCRGLQVWYSPNNTHSLTLASEIRENASEVLNAQNDRPLKRAGSSIYLLHRITSPAVLVECGFLSNPEEAELLATEEYQQRIATALFLAIVRTEFTREEA